MPLVYGSRYVEDDTIRKLQEHNAHLREEVKHWRRIAETTPVSIVVERGDYTEILGKTNLILAAGFSKLRRAIRTLVQAHTRDDHQMGFVVEGSPMLHPFSEITRDEYIEALRVLRKEIGAQTDPEKR